jgi:hypothetical protein
MLILLPKSAVQVISLLISHGFNAFIAVLAIKFCIDSLLEGNFIFAAITGSVGLLIGGVTIYYARKSFLRALQEVKDAVENESKNG